MLYMLFLQQVKPSWLDQLAITTGGVLKERYGDVAIAIAEEAVTTSAATGRVIARIINSNL